MTLKCLVNRHMPHILINAQDISMAFSWESESMAWQQFTD